jgi:hypothetical protein
MNQMEANSPLRASLLPPSCCQVKRGKTPSTGECSLSGTGQNLREGCFSPSHQLLWSQASFCFFTNCLRIKNLLRSVEFKFTPTYPNELFLDWTCQPAEAKVWMCSVIMRTDIISYSLSEEKHKVRWFMLKREANGRKSNVRRDLRHYLELDVKMQPESFHPNSQRLL